MSNKTQYVAINTIVFKDELADRKDKPVTYPPKSIFDANPGDAEIQRLLKKGAIKTVEQVEQENVRRAETVAARKAREKAEALDKAKADEAAAQAQADAKAKAETDAKSAKK